MSDPAARWEEALAGWAIPEPILAAAPESPWGFPTDLFAQAADDALQRETPTTDIARDALPAGGTVLDVGCGGGAASLPLAGRADRLTGVDESGDLLDEFEERARRLGVEVDRIHGRWPDVADRAPVADLVVCRNVAYNVPDLAPFVAALTGHARQRVVLELTAEHPLVWLRPYWRDLHGVGFPDGPTVEDALEVIRATGVEPEVRSWEDRVLFAERSEPDLLAFLQKRLCLTDERRPELEAALERHGVPPAREIATVWWAGGAG